MLLPPQASTGTDPVDDKKTSAGVETLGSDHNRHRYGLAAACTVTPGLLAAAHRGTVPEVPGKVLKLCTLDAGLEVLAGVQLLNCDWRSAVGRQDLLGPAHLAAQLGQGLGRVAAGKQEQQRRRRANTAKMQGDDGQ